MKTILIVIGIDIAISLLVIGVLSLIYKYDRPRFTGIMSHLRWFSYHAKMTFRRRIDFQSKTRNIVETVEIEFDHLNEKYYARVQMEVDTGKVRNINFCFDDNLKTVPEPEFIEMVNSMEKVALNTYNSQRGNVITKLFKRAVS